MLHGDNDTSKEKIPMDRDTFAASMSAAGADNGGTIIKSLSTTGDGSADDFRKKLQSLLLNSNNIRETCPQTAIDVWNMDESAKDESFERGTRSGAAISAPSSASSATHHHHVGESEEWKRSIGRGEVHAVIEDRENFRRHLMAMLGVNRSNAPKSGQEQEKESPFSPSQNPVGTTKIMQSPPSTPMREIRPGSPQITKSALRSRRIEASKSSLGFGSSEVDALEDMFKEFAREVDTPDEQSPAMRNAQVSRIAHLTSPTCSREVHLTAVSTVSVATLSLQPSNEVNLIHSSDAAYIQQDLDQSLANNSDACTLMKLSKPDCSEQGSLSLPAKQELDNAENLSPSGEEPSPEEASRIASSSIDIGDILQTESVQEGNDSGRLVSKLKAESFALFMTIWALERWFAEVMILFDRCEHGEALRRIGTHGWVSHVLRRNQQKQGKILRSFRRRTFSSNSMVSQVLFYPTVPMLLLGVLAIIDLAMFAALVAIFGTKLFLYCSFLF